MRADHDRPLWESRPTGVGQRGFAIGFDRHLGDQLDVRRMNDRD